MEQRKIFRTNILSGEKEIYENIPWRGEKILEHEYWRKKVEGFYFVTKKIIYQFFFKKCQNKTFGKIEMFYDIMKSSDCLKVVTKLGIRKITFIITLGHKSNVHTSMI